MDDKRYRECMAEIIGVLKKYDMAGAVTVVDKHRAMFKYHFPAWTCVLLGEDQVRLRLKGSEYPSREAAKETAELTAHVIMQMRDIAANTFKLCDHLGDKMREAWGMEHTPNVDFDPERSN
jgi:hypothetical protein